MSNKHEVMAEALFASPDSNGSTAAWSGNASAAMGGVSDSGAFAAGAWTGGVCMGGAWAGGAWAGGALAGGPRGCAGGTGFVLDAVGVQAEVTIGITGTIPSSTQTPQKFTLRSISFLRS